MKLKMFEYVMLLHPKDEKSKESTVILKSISTLLAKDEKQVGILAAREIPAKNLGDLDRVEIIVRPF